MGPDTIYLILLGVLGLLFFSTVIAALVWAAKSGQLRNFDKGARVIFDEDEPEGEQTDFFPGDKDSQKKYGKRPEKSRRSKRGNGVQSQ